jgi:hypothetical protein
VHRVHSHKHQKLACAHQRPHADQRKCPHANTYVQTHPRRRCCCVNTADRPSTCSCKPLKPAFWGDLLAATTSSVWYSQPVANGHGSEGGSSTSSVVAGALRIVTNVSVHGTWHPPGKPLSGVSTGTACLTASLPQGGDWYYPAGTVGTWFCDTGNKTEDVLTEWLIADGDAPMLVMASNTDMCLTAVDSVPQVPPHPQPKPNPNGTTCADGCRSEPCSSMPFCDMRLRCARRAWQRCV